MMPLMKNQKERTDDVVNEHFTVTLWLTKTYFLTF